MRDRPQIFLVASGGTYLCLTQGVFTIRFGSSSITRVSQELSLEALGRLVRLIFVI